MIQFTINPLSTDNQVVEYLMKSNANHAGQVLVQHQLMNKQGTAYTQGFWESPEEEQEHMKKHPTSEKTKDGWIFHTQEAVMHALGENPNDTKKCYGKWYKGTTPAEQDAIKAYTGLFYITINNLLRKVQTKLKPNPQIIKKINKYIPQIRSAIDKFELPEPIIVYRNMDKRDIGLFKEGGYFKDLGFTSTTAIKNSYLPKKYQNGCIELVIKVPAGKGIGAWVAPMSKLKKENEFLLNCNTDYKVHKVSTTEKGYRVELEALPAGTVNELLKKAGDNQVFDNTDEPQHKFIWRADDLIFFDSLDELKKWGE